MRVRRFGRKSVILIKKILISIVFGEKNDAFEYDLPEYDMFLGFEVRPMEIDGTAGKDIWVSADSIIDGVGKYLPVLDHFISFIF